MELIAATSNPGKLREFRRILGPLGVRVLSAADAGASPDVEETGETFAENAAIKARAIYERTGLPSLADDSGLCVDALGGRPGVRSARYGGGDTPHSEKMKLLLEELRGVPDEKRTARFACAVCCVLDDNTAIAAEGFCEGKIGYAPVGGGGFGYDPVFMVGERSFAELPAEEKDAVSHRGVALRSFAEKLQGLLQER